MNHLAKFALITLLPLLLLGAECQPTPVNPPTPPASGGSVSTGGSPATGGVGPVAGAAGQASTGGAATGGSQATGGAPKIALPTCPTFARPRAAAPIPKLSGWKKDPNWQSQIKLDAPKRKALGATAPADVWWFSNLAAPLDQNPYGACVGFGTAGISSTRPWKRIATNADGFRAYEVASRIDNGCPPLTASYCAGAWPNADNGSYSSSGMKAGVLLGWFKSWSSVPDVVTLKQRMQIGPCGIGKTWHNNEFAPLDTPEECGRLMQVGAVAGGHFMNVNAYVDGRVYVDNSWGNWGACLDSLCGYAYITEGDLAAEIASGDAELVCPQ